MSPDAPHPDTLRPAVDGTAAATAVATAVDRASAPRVAYTTTGRAPASIPVTTSSALLHSTRAAASSVPIVPTPAATSPVAHGYPPTEETGGGTRGWAIRESPPAYGSADPFEDDADALDELEERIVVLAAHIHAAEHRFLTLVAEFDRRGGWKRAGHRDCADWLQFNTGLSRSTAREKVRVARALERLPLVGRAMGRGELSFSKVRALARLVDDIGRPVEEEGGSEAEDEDGMEDARADDGVSPEGADTPEAQLVEYAGKCTTAELERLVRSWRLVNRVDEQELERRRHAARHLTVAPDGDGTYVLRGRLDPEVGALLMRAVEAAGDALFRSRTDWAPEGGRRGPLTRDVTPRQRRADALGLLAERALVAGFGEEEDRGPRSNGTRAERYQVFLHVDEATLRKDADGGRSHLEDGTRVSAETARRLTCDAAVVRVMRGKDGSVLDVGRKTRTIPPALRRALEIRDGGCRFPGCGLRFTEGHHIVHWEDGGETSLTNLVNLCRVHHRLVHEEGFGVRRRADGSFRFSDRTGWPLPDFSPPPRLGPRPVRRLMDDNVEDGVAPDFDTPRSTYRCGADIPSDVYLRTREALEARA